jgi:acyl-CoA thioesterase FadM
MSDKFLYRRALRFAETDMAGVGHFAAILTMVEEAWHAYLADLGECVHPACAPPGADPVGWPVASLQVDFLHPVHFGEHLAILLEVARVGSRSVTLRFTIKGPAAAIAQGSITTVCTTLAGSGQWSPRPLPSSLAGKLSGK